MKTTVFVKVKLSVVNFAPAKRSNSEKPKQEMSGFVASLVEELL